MRTPKAPNYRKPPVEVGWVVPFGVFLLALSMVRGFLTGSQLGMGSDKAVD